MGGTPAYPDGVATITPAADTTALTILTINYSNVTVPAKIGRLPFEIRDPAGETDATSSFLVVVTADGSGSVLINNQASLDVHEIPETAGVPGKTFKFLYTAIGTQGGLRESE